MFRNPLVILAMVLGCGPLLGEAQHALLPEPVEGAFGMILGAEFIPDEALHDSTTINGEKSYFFSPAAQSRFFDFYLVQITPLTHRVHTIIAVGQTPDVETCQQRRSTLLPQLTAKYGRSINYGPLEAAGFDLDYEMIVQRDPKRGVGVMCGGTSPIVFQLIYLDDELSDLAEQEGRQLIREAKLRL